MGRVGGAVEALQRLEQREPRAVHEDLVRDARPEPALDAAHALGARDGHERVHEVVVAHDRRLARGRHGVRQLALQLHARLDDLHRVGHDARAARGRARQQELEEEPALGRHADWPATFALVGEEVQVTAPLNSTRTTPAPDLGFVCRYRFNVLAIGQTNS